MKRFVVGFLIGGFILFILLKRIDLNQLIEILISVNITLLIISLIFKLFVMWIKSFRWAVTLRKSTGQSIRRSFSASMIGFAGNIILPARLGELARASVIDKHNRISRTLAITTLGINQLFDLLFLVGYFLILSIWLTDLYKDYRWEIGIIGFVILLILGGLTIFQKKFQSLSFMFKHMSSVLPKSFEKRFHELVNLLVKGLKILNEAQAVVWVILLTFIIWGLETLAVYCMLVAFHIKANLLMAGLMVVILNMSFAFPITPGNIGIVQAISVILLGTFGVSQASALTYSIASQGITYLVTVTLGIIFFYFEKMDLYLLRQEAKDKSPLNTASIIDIK